MRIAIPLQDGRLSAHFGRCEAYAFLDVDDGGREITAQKVVESPPHQPGVLPAWVSENGADVVITGGMGPRAVQLFQERGVDVVLGAPALEPEAVASAYLEGKLTTTDNTCDHD